MKTQNFISTGFTMLLICTLLFSCEKKDSGEDELIATAKSGQLSCKIDGKVYSHNGSGYVLGNDHSFVKAENGGEQFSIDFYGMAEGDYKVSDGAKANGNAKLYYYPGADKVVYISKSGLFKVSKYQTTGGFKASGTFSGKFEKYINNNEPTGTIIEVVDGSFTDITLIDAR